MCSDVREKRNPGMDGVNQMIKRSRCPKIICSFLAAPRHLLWLLVLPLIAVFVLPPLTHAAKPGGVPVLLPPFIPVQPPNPFVQPVSPFAIVGFIQSATVDNATDVFSSGTVVVNGISITVPRNTLFQMPASPMTWQEVFSNAPAAYKRLDQTGLTLPY